MEILQAILLGIVEGLTEFLPISSTGHLIVAQDLLGYRDVAELFTVVIQVGAIAAVIWHYRWDLLERTRGLISRQTPSLHFWRNWIIATIPAGLTGLFLGNLIGRAAQPLTIGLALVAGGFAILAIEQMVAVPKALKTGEEQISKLSPAQAVKVGLFQVLALIPGVSRSGATIMGGLIVGVDRVTATAFSFYLGIPVIVLASGYKLATGWSDIPNISGGGSAVIAGVIAAFITALIAINWLLKYVAHHDFKLFAYYRLVLGAIIILAVMTNHL